MLDKQKLLEFLDRKAQDRGVDTTSGLVITAIYAGLADRIRSGEFEEN